MFFKSSQIKLCPEFPLRTLDNTPTFLLLGITGKQREQWTKARTTLSVRATNRTSLKKKKSVWRLTKDLVKLKKTKNRKHHVLWMAEKETKDKNRKMTCKVLQLPTPTCSCCFRSRYSPPYSLSMKLMQERICTPWHPDTQRVWYVWMEAPS